jgi:hypothetical protein
MKNAHASGPDSHSNAFSYPQKIKEHSLSLPQKKEVEQLETEPRFDQIREDLASMFLIHVENEEMLQNPYVKDELYKAVKEDLMLNRYFALDYMAQEKLHVDGEPLLTRDDFKKRGIRSLQDHGRTILHAYEHKGPTLMRIKELFVLTGMFTEQEIESELHRSQYLN